MKNVESRIATQFKIDRNTRQNLVYAKRVSCINGIVQWRISINILFNNPSCHSHIIDLKYENKGIENSKRPGYWHRIHHR